MLELVHLILDPELAFFQTPDLQFVGIVRKLQASNHLIEIAMLDAQFEQTAG